jgi:hypothetical protein
MKTLFMKKYSFALLLLLASIVLLLAAFKKPTVINTQPAVSGNTAKIQVAILLDVSNSMDGLIEQAKAQLWNMASVMGKARCGNDIVPQIEMALYEYGRSTNDSRQGYVKQVSGFTTDLNALSKSLFDLKTNGGEEYCSQVMYTSLTELKWDTSAANYKVIFIAGNEDFLQGRMSFTTACAEAKKKGVIVNTIYCGDKMAGIREHWNITGECGTGSYTNINQDAALEDIHTPYDSMLFVLNDQLNQTYIAYGTAGRAKFEEQASVDKMNYQMNKAAAAKRVEVKVKKNLYKNEHWDLVDAAETDPGILNKVEMKTLPVELQQKSRAELKQLVQQKTSQRGTLQQQIAAISTKREAYIIAERKKNQQANTAATLETQIEKIIRQQAKKYNIAILPQ